MKEATKSYKSIHTILPYLGLPHEDYWHIDYEVNSMDAIMSTGDYFWDVREKYKGFTGEYDELGVPLYLGADGENYYSVIFLGHYGIGAFQEYISCNCSKALDDLITVSDWLVDNQSDAGFWVNTYPMETFSLGKDKSSWVSSLAQAKGISTLVRTYRLTGNSLYLNCAIKAGNTFLSEPRNGSTVVLHGGVKIFEEYPTKSSSAVLNGHIFSIWSLFDLLQYKKDMEPKSLLKFEDLYNSAIKDLSENLHKWDTGSWSRYDIWDEHYNIASLFYHDLHIKQLNILYNITKVQDFKEYSIRWFGYRNSFFRRILALINKIRFRLNV